MKTLIGLTVLSALLGALGCTTPEKSWVADQPPPLAKTPASPAAKGPGKLDLSKRISADDIDDANVEDQIRLMDNQMQTERRAMTRAGK